MAKWIFAEAPIGVDQGPNSSTGEHFKSQDIFSALVRESIQNSLDVPLDCNEPVVVQYAFGSITGQLCEDIRKVEEHVIHSRDEYPASTAYQRMADFLESHNEQEISYLRVSDSNTTGMDYKKGDNKCGFYSFVNSIGNSSKNSAGAGGSYGFGKAAYYEFSNSRSVLVSSRTQDGSCTFQGCSMLCTHHIGDKKYNYSGFFDNGDGVPIQDINQIPEKFRRKESGSDIYLLHVDANPNKMKEYEDSIVRSVLLNFWMAIYKGKLVVSFDWQDDGEEEVVINKSTLEKLMSSYFPGMEDVAEGTNGYCNPRPYYEAVKTAQPYDPNSETDQNCVLFENLHLKNVGHVQFYLMRNINTKDRYLRMRQRYMVIDGISIRGQRGLSGVLVCEEGVANDCLRKAEPPAHDEWDIKRVAPFKSQPDTEEGKAYKAIKALDKYVKECIRQYFANSVSRDIEIYGLENFLYATEDYSGRKGDNDSKNGEESGEISKKDNGSIVSTPNGPTINLNEQAESKPGFVTIITRAPEGKEARGDVTPVFPDKTNPIPTPPNPNPDPNPIYPPTPPVIPDDDTDAPHIPQRMIKPVKCRPTAQYSDGGLVYTARILTEEDLENADIHITTQGEEGEEDIDLAWSDKGVVRQSCIYGVDLKSGVVNELRFRFEDNLKHKISLIAYVTK